MTDPRCRLCAAPAVAVFGLSRGCVARPDDRVQALCGHHALRSTPRDGIDLLADLTVGAEFTAIWEGRERS